MQTAVRLIKVLKIISSLSLGLCILSIQLVHAGSKKPCQSVLQSAFDEFTKGKLGETRVGYELRSANYRFNGNRNVNIHNQGTFGSCWGLAALSYLEACALNHHGLKVELSENYLVAQYLLLNAESAIKSSSYKDQLKTPALHDNGGLFTKALLMISKYGAVPTKAWKARLFLGKSETEDQRLLLYLNLRIADLIKNQRVKSKSSIAQSLKKIKKDFEAYFGPFPDHFSIKGSSRKFTPKSYATEILQLEQLLPYLKLKTIKGPRNAKKIALAIVSQLEAFQGKIPVPVVLNWTDIFHTKKNDLFSIDAFLPLTEPFYRSVQNIGKLVTPQSPHQLLITDYEPGPEGIPLRFLAANSHGIGYGDRGYVHIDWDYFETFVEYAEFIDPLFKP